MPRVRFIDAKVLKKTTEQGLLNQNTGKNKIFFQNYLVRITFCTTFAPANQPRKLKGR